jgi:hypothetical protein
MSHFGHGDESAFGTILGNLSLVVPKIVLIIIQIIKKML